jgi:hypothetical protein
VDGKAVGSLGNSELVWHQDMSYNELPPKASLLYGIETPSAGGETFFYNLYDACATLPHTLKSRIHGLSCKHDATRNSSGQLRKGFAERYSNAERPGAIHPLIVRHPETDRSSLYMGRRPNAWIVGLSDADSDALLDELWAHVKQGPHLWVQKWHQGSRDLGQPVHPAPPQPARPLPAASDASHAGPRQGPACRGRRANLTRGAQSANPISVAATCHRRCRWTRSGA